MDHVEETAVDVVESQTPAAAVVVKMPLQKHSHEFAYP